MREASQTVNKNLKAVKWHEELLSLVYRSQLSEAVRCLRGAPPETAGRFFAESFGKSPICREMLYLSSQICPKGERKAKKADPVIVACPKNPLSLLAVRKLTEDKMTVRITEQQDFRSACENVVTDGAHYCIIPVCSSYDGYYPTFSKLIKTYELKICKTVRISKPDSDEELQFALLSKTLEIPKSAHCAVFSFAGEDKDTLSLLISALHGAGSPPLSITSSPLEYNMDRFEHRIEISLGELSPEALLYFLEASLPGHTVLGIY